MKISIHRRHHSYTDPSNQTNLYGILQSLDPQGEQVIRLENMSNLLDRLPLKVRGKVQTIFHNYVFEHRSFDLPVIDFIKRFGEIKDTFSEVKENSVLMENRAEVYSSFKKSLATDCTENNPSGEENRKAPAKKKARKQKRFASIYELIKVRKAHLAMNKDKSSK